MSEQNKTKEEPKKKLFNYVMSNPPYQADDCKKQVYPVMYNTAKEVSECVEMIFPAAWQDAKRKQGLALMNNEEVKRDPSIILIKNTRNMFPGVTGAEHTNIIMRKEGYDNGLDGKQRIIDEDGNTSHVLLPIEKSEIEKPAVVRSLVDKIASRKEESFIAVVSTQKPYHLPTDALKKPDKYSLTLSMTPGDNSVRLFGKIDGEGRSSRYIPRESLPYATASLDRYKVFLPKAWGNMDEKAGFLGGSYSSAFIAEPKDCCTEMYAEIGPFDNRETAENVVKYLSTKFLRAALYKNKFGQDTPRLTFQDVPLQDFTPQSDIDWSVPIPEIDQQLYKKYGLDENEIEFIETHIKPMS